ncbi:hypothetical protein J4734_26575, partial [Klebsiella pneumoniae]|nr:hypothetical protein [Klebsiella pneumoniae]
GGVRNPSSLKTLFLIMTRYIKPEERFGSYGDCYLLHQRSGMMLKAPVNCFSVVSCNSEGKETMLL